MAREGPSGGGGSIRPGSAAGTRGSASMGELGVADLSAAKVGPEGDLQVRNQNFWAERTAVSRNRERGVPVKFFPLELGADRVKLPLDVWKKATDKFAFALVGFVFGSKPPLGKMKAFVRNRWGEENVVKVSVLNEGIFLLNFSSEEKKNEVMLGGPWSFDNRPLIVKVWKEDEDYRCGSVDSLPVWVRLPGIKAHLADLDILGMLGSRLGRPLCTDGIPAEGTSYCYARMCIELFADKEPAEEIVYEDPFGNMYSQKVIYEWFPPRCTNCLNFGHLVSKCPEPNLEQVIEGWKAQENEERLQTKCRVEASVEDDLSSVNPAAQDADPVGECCSKDVVPETQLEAPVGDPSAVVLGESGFKQVQSKSALKKAKLKEKLKTLEIQCREDSISSSSTLVVHKKSLKKNKVRKGEIRKTGEDGLKNSIFLNG